MYMCVCAGIYIIYLDVCIATNKRITRERDCRRHRDYRRPRGLCHPEVALREPLVTVLGEGVR